MWKLNKSGKVLLDDSPEEEDNHLQASPSAPSPAATFSSAQIHLVHSLAHLQTAWNVKEVYDKYLNYECEGGFPDVFAGNFGAHGFACSGTAEAPVAHCSGLVKKGNLVIFDLQYQELTGEKYFPIYLMEILKVQGAGFRGWKEVTSIFSKDDEQQLLTGCKSPKSKGTNLKLKEDVKLEKKAGFWDSLVIKQNLQSRKPDEIEGWEPPQIPASDHHLSDAGNTLCDYASWSGWEDETKGSTKYTNLASSGNSSRWSIKSAGRLVSIRRQSKGNLTDNWEELE